MPKCQVCAHPEVVRLEALRAAGASLQSLGERFGLSKDAVWRHWTRCVSKERKGTLLIGEGRLQNLMETAVEENRSLLEYLALVRSILVNQLATAAECGDRHGTAYLSGRLLETLREIGKLTGEIPKLAGGSITNNNTLILATPQFAELQTTLIRTLQPFPEARAAVISALRDLEHQSGPMPMNGAPMLEATCA